MQTFLTVYRKLAADHPSCHDVILETAESQAMQTVSPCQPLKLRRNRCDAEKTRDFKNFVLSEH